MFLPLDSSTIGVQQPESEGEAHVIEILGDRSRVEEGEGRSILLRPSDTAELFIRRVRLFGAEAETAGGQKSEEEAGAPEVFISRFIATAAVAAGSRK